MSKVKCDYCGSYIDSTDTRCPNCGAVNNNYVRTTDDTPKTIEELQDWYRAMNLPPYETTRFFIGEDRQESKCFGIYQDGENFVVYKNKSNGERAVRYSGQDEAYAVNELYMRLKSEILNQKEQNQNRRSAKQKRNIFAIAVVCIWAVTMLSMQMMSCISGRHTGYYTYNNANYYYSGDMDTWYLYDSYYDDWYSTTTPATGSDSIWNYKSSDFEDNWSGKTVENSQAYTNDYNDYKASSDSDSSWSSSDSWDSGSTNWDSDW